MDGKLIMTTKTVHKSQLKTKISNIKTQLELEVINIMIDKINNMTNDELKKIVYKYNCPDSIKDAILYIQNCEKDM